MVDKNWSKKETALALKFISKKLKNLSTDEYGHLQYLKNFNKVFEDVFGYKKFGTRLNDCYDNNEHVRVIQSFGFPLLMVICNTPKFYNAIHDLIEMDARMEDIKDRVRKNQKKGKKKDKDLVKEFEYLSELYKDTVKVIRKKLGLKQSSNYKKKYRSAADIANGNRGNFFSNDDDDDFDIVSFGDDDDMDEDTVSDFERYLRRAQGIPESRKPKRTPSRSNFGFDDDDDDTLDDEDESDEDDDSDEIDKDTDKKFDRLTQVVTDLATMTQYLVNQQMEVNQSEGYVANKLAEKIRPQTNMDMTKINNDMTNLAKTVQTLVQSQTRIVENQENINEFISALSESMNVDDEDDPEDLTVDQDAQAPSMEDIIEYMNTRPINMGTHQSVKVKTESVEVQQENQPNTTDVPIVEPTPSTESSE